MTIDIFKIIYYHISKSKMSSSDSDTSMIMDINVTDATSSSTRSSSTTRLAGVSRPSDTNEPERNVRPNRGGLNLRNDGKGIYLEKNCLDISNISVTKSNTPGVMQRRPFNPDSQLIALSDLINNGSTYGTNLILIILSISAVTTNNMTMYQQKSNGIKGGANTVRHDRNMVVVCLLSPSGNNTAMVLFGAGCCKRFFYGDISLRDNGEIREYQFI